MSAAIRGTAPAGSGKGNPLLHTPEQAALLAHSLEHEWNSDPANDPFAIPLKPASQP